ncbi:right-handed parallel beta-helix repeat-containing protein [Chryseobacterium sp.]|uniref:right-handed parallel beta-helix repeat-containing protein n=1 Tax=Chryseobacterium sp. TaxID=1871047 RepID=UPI0025BF34ED|nr:right-handed parallel beta-helix repeat-containing protein [Chryseobacterium sp.]MBV8324924.1 hypothetical protein [Chryseobacterium sp.]
MTNNLNLMTIDSFFSSSDPILDLEMVSLIDSFSGETVNFRKQNTPVPENGKYLYRIKINNNSTTSYYRRVVSNSISIKIADVYGDGLTDDSGEIQRLIDEMEAGQVLELDNRRYMLYQPLQINKTIKITGSSTKRKDGYPPFLITNNNHGIVINAYKTLVNGNEVTINASGTVLEGFGIYNTTLYTTTPNNFTGIKVNGTSDVHAYDIILKDLTINGYQTGLEVIALWSSQIQTVKIGNCQVGIHVKENSVNNEISNNTTISIDIIIENPITGEKELIDIPGSKGILFDGDTTQEGWRIIDTLIFNVYQGIYAEKTSHVNVLNSMIDFCRHIGIVIAEKSYNWNINSNYIALSHPGYGVYLANNDPNTAPIRGNKIIDNDILIYDHAQPDNISIGINIVGEGSLYDDVRGNSVKNFKVYDIRAKSGLKTTITHNKCLSEINPNIIGNCITNDNLGTVYYQNLNDSLHLGKVRITYADHYPSASSSEWKRGDIILNTSPSVDAPIGWVNTTDGQNTWKPFGIINN